MALVISATLTNKGREVLAKSFGGPIGSYNWSYGKYFKIGTLGFEDVGGDDHPKTPDPALLDLESSVSGSFWYRKTFEVSDLLFVGPGTMQFKCFLDLLEGNGTNETDTAVNLDGPKNTSWLSGGVPTFFELGVFDNEDNLIAYGTFPGEVKLNTKTLNHLVNVNF
jgi:hypothetical protein